jgi:hypothetical protein
MHLKEFSFVSPAIPNGEVLKAIEAAIPPEAIEQASPNGQAPLGHRAFPSPRVSHTFVTSTFSGLSCNCDELVVKGLDAGCTQKLN